MLSQPSIALFEFFEIQTAQSRQLFFLWYAVSVFIVLCFVGSLAAAWPPILHSSLESAGTSRRISFHVTRRCSQMNRWWMFSMYSSSPREGLSQAHRSPAPYLQIAARIQWISTSRLYRGARWRRTLLITYNFWGWSNTSHTSFRYRIYSDVQEYKVWTHSKGCFCLAESTATLSMDLRWWKIGRFVILIRYHPEATSPFYQIQAIQECEER